MNQHNKQDPFIERSWKGARLLQEPACTDPQALITLKLALGSYSYLIPLNTTWTAQQWVDAIAKTHSIESPQTAAVIESIKDAAGFRDDQLLPGVADFIRCQMLNKELIDAMAAEIIEIDDDAHYELIDGIKGHLASVGANATHEDDADEAIELAEAWVTSHLSQSDIRGDAAMAIWLWGVDNGCHFLRENKVPQPIKAERIGS